MNKEAVSVEAKAGDLVLFYEEEENRYRYERDEPLTIVRRRWGRVDLVMDDGRLSVSHYGRYWTVRPYMIAAKGKNLDELDRELRRLKDEGNEYEIRIRMQMERLTRPKKR